MFKRPTNKIINYRLSPSELNASLYKIAAQVDPTIEDDTASTNFSKFIQSYLPVKCNNKQFYIMPMCKDAENQDNEAYLPFIKDSIEKFCKANQNSEGKLLIPMRLCRGYLYLPVNFPHAQRKHAVLVVVDMKDKKIEILDSQGWLRKQCYPDKLANAGDTLTIGKEVFKYNPKIHYHPFGTQEGVVVSNDMVSCGFYVIAYVKHILLKDEIPSCKDVKLSVTKSYTSKWDYLRGLGVDISYKPPVSHRIFESIQKEFVVIKPDSEIEKNSDSPRQALKSLSLFTTPDQNRNKLDNDFCFIQTPCQ